MAKWPGLSRGYKQHLRDQVKRDIGTGAIYGRTPEEIKEQLDDGWEIPHNGGCEGAQGPDYKCVNPMCGYQGEGYNQADTPDIQYLAKQLHSCGLSDSPGMVEQLEEKVDLLIQIVTILTNERLNP